MRGATVGSLVVGWAGNWRLRIEVEDGTNKSFEAFSFRFFFQTPPNSQIEVLDWRRQKISKYLK